MTLMMKGYISKRCLNGRTKRTLPFFDERATGVPGAGYHPVFLVAVAGNNFYWVISDFFNPEFYALRQSAFFLMSA
jgi:hypothetical protein